MYAHAVLLLVLFLALPVHGVFQPANRTELKAGVELYMRDPEEAMRTSAISRGALTPPPALPRRTAIR